MPPWPLPPGSETPPPYADGGSRQVQQNNCTIRLLGENGAPAPAPARIVPGSARLLFHSSLTVYWPAGNAKTVCAKAALGEKVPSTPPLSFQPVMPAG